MAKKVLIIDDDQTIYEAFSLVLEVHGFTVNRATDGKSGLELAETFKPDLILLDMLMPYMGGVEFLEQYQQPKLHPQVIIIGLTNSEVADETEEKCLQLGAAGYFRKSNFTPNQIVELVQHHLGMPGEASK